MASRRPPSSSSSVSPLFAASRLELDSCYKPNEGILEISKAVDAGTQQETKQAETDTFVAQTDEEDECFKHSHHHPNVFLDSGANFHVTGDKALLATFSMAAPAGSPAAYHARDGRVLNVAGVGTIACENFQISDVYYVPGLGTGLTLVSVQQFAEKDFLVMFGRGRCYVKDPSSGSLVGKGRLHVDDGLYHLEFLRMCTTDHTAAGTDATVS